MRVLTNGVAIAALLVATVAAQAPPPAPAPGGSAQRKPVGFEKDYGHVL